MSANWSRKDVLVALGTFGVAGATNPPGRHRVGLLRADDYGAQHVDKVLLDGREVEGVFELNDAEGWVRRYRTFPGGAVLPEFLTGEVTIVWKLPEGGAP